LPVFCKYYQHHFVRRLLQAAFIQQHIASSIYKQQFASRMLAIYQYFPVIILFGINEDIALPAAFCGHHFVSAILSPVLSTSILPAVCHHFSAAFCHQYILSSILPAAF